MSCSEMLMTAIREERLDNGLRILFVDETNRYFGDYHRVCVRVTLLYDLDQLPVTRSDDELFRDRALAALGQELKIVKRLERMGVPTAEVEEVRHSMIESFLITSSAYLDRPGYPRSLVDAELKKHRGRSFYG